jgi:hypothetical protein
VDYFLKVQHGVQPPMGNNAHFIRFFLLESRRCELSIVNRELDPERAIIITSPSRYRMRHGFQETFEEIKRQLSAILISVIKTDQKICSLINRTFDLHIRLVRLYNRI